MSDSFVVIDGFSLLHRAFFALPVMNNSKGVYTNAVYGFCNMLLKIIEDYQPAYLAVAFDHKGPTFRHKEYPEYKGGRKPTPPELLPQFDLMREVLRALKIPCIELQGYEADDIMGTFSAAAEQKQIPCLLVTGDRDAWQLIGPMTTVVMTRKGLSQVELLDAPALGQSMGITPSQVTDLKGLMGDSSDNIPGVPGVGEKTALKLLSQFGTLEEVLSHIDEVSGKKLQEKLIQFADLARMSKHLATIDRTVPVAPDFAACRLTWPPDAEGFAMLEELELKNLIARIREKTGAAPENAEPAIETESVAVQSIDALREEADKLRGTVAFTLSPEKVTIADRAERQITVQLSQSLLDEAGALPAEEVLRALKPLLEDEKIPKLVHESKNLYYRLLPLGIELRGVVFDTAIAAYLIEATASDYSPGRLIAECGLPGREDAAALVVLKEKQEQKLKAMGSGELFETVEMPLIRVLIDMEREGFRIDKAALKAVGDEMKERIAKLTEAIYDRAGQRFNINSTKQLGEVLFEKLQLPHGKKTKTGYSTNNEVLESLRDMDPIIDDIIAYRQLTKLNSTYVDGMLTVVSPSDGKIHTRFQQTVTATGRISSTEPNLQNIPIRTEEGRELRRFFVPDGDGRILVDADYSQIELRVLAHVSEDERLMDAFRKGQDIHTRTAAEMWGVPMEKVTGEMRSRAKAINFGIIYGISDFGLARNTRISRKQAAEFIKRYFETYPRVKAYMDETVEKAKADGYVTTFMGRVRPLPELRSSNYNQRSFGERVAMNAPIQGAAADIIKLAMIRVHDRLKEELPEGRLILQVHDELIVDVPEDKCDPAIALMREQMQNAVKLRVPLVAEIETGKTWYEAK